MHVHHGLSRVKRLLLVGETVLGLWLRLLRVVVVVLALRERVHLTIVRLLHLGGMAGVVGVLSLRGWIGGIVGKRRLWCHGVCGVHCD